MTDDHRGMSRRAFLAATVAAALAGCGDDDSPGSSTPADTDRTPTAAPDATAVPPTATPAPTTAPTAPAVDLPDDPFTLGVASGDPVPTGVILWTRLAPEPLAGGGMPDERVDVAWEIASDDAFTALVASGSAPAVPGLAHSVHVAAAGLEPDSWYWYRFRVGPHTSPAGRTRTLPAAASSPAALRLGFGSCQHWEAGFYAAHRHLAAEDLDLYLWLGDYIYEGGPTTDPITSADGRVRVHNGPEPTDLAGYRDRYALYRSDGDLQRHHASRPWLVTWDDHEVDNDYAGAVSQDDDPAEVFLARRAAAYQAWYEHMPVRLDPPEGPDYRIYRDLAWGDLAEILVLDGRQYRDDQPTDGDVVPIPGFEDADLPLRTLGPTALDPEQRLLGAEQEAWLLGGLRGSTRAWKLVAQQVFMHGLDVVPGEAPLTLTDTWDGYAGNRREILQALADAGVEDLVVLTGDFHAATVAELRADPYDLDSPVVGTELMATSISSSFPEAGRDAAPVIMAFNPQIKFFDADKGYTVCEITPDSCTAVFKTLTDVTDPGSSVQVAATFAVDRGVPGPRQLA